ncbi:hypothetical protein [Salinicoccus halitifaciens]|uniref:MarR family transcriptional regulator n=1 Tax=Salinicoccus halitifaciens TaxID=1073415 RepID=A0ABV2E8Y7_9STAP|nr:hypothetical protein [Salinicoccus halitifaciens]MCD2137999.1 hypothetical protein [Salinicoccus halitifaciens]
MNNRMILPLQMECLMLFQSDPQSTHSLEDLSACLGEKAECLESVISLLVKQGIIKQIQEAEHKVYRYREPEISPEFEIGP